MGQNFFLVKLSKKIVKSALHILSSNTVKNKIKYKSFFEQKSKKLIFLLLIS